jgi:outer membrane lipoprotein-sorting protein
MITENDLEQKIRRLGQKVASNPSIVQTVRQRILAEGLVPIRHPHFWPSKRILQILTVTAAAAALFLAINYWPANSRTGLAWADVVYQIRSARTIYLHGVERTGTGPERICNYYFKSPGLIRQNTGNSTTIINGKKQMSFNSLTKLYLIEPIHQIDQNLVEALFALCGLSGTQEMKKDTTPTMQAGRGNVRLGLAGVEIKEGRTLRKYAIEILANEKYTKSGFFLWFDLTDNQIVRLTVENPNYASISATVKLNTEIPDEMFSLTPPPGYADITKGPLPRLSPEVRKIAEAYYAARERLSPYRMVVWNGKWPMYREVRQADRWRLDRLGWEKMVTNRAKYSFTGPDQDFASAWSLVGVPDTPVSTTMFTYNGRIAIVGYEFGGTGPKLQTFYVNRPREGWQAFNQFRLGEFAWPEIRDDGLHTPLAWTIDEPPIQYQLLPPDPNRPALIRIRGTRDRKVYHFYEYWLDPEKDYLCIRYEERQMPDRAEIQEITEFGKTPDNRWFPKTVKRYGCRVANNAYGTPSYGPLFYQVRIDTSRPIDKNLFIWPTGVPKPK